MLHFGVKNGPPCVHIVAHIFFGDLPFVVVYIDDIVIKSSNWKEHMENLNFVLGLLRNFGLKFEVEG